MMERIGRGPALAAALMTVVLCLGAGTGPAAPMLISPPPKATITARDLSRFVIMFSWRSAAASYRLQVGTEEKFERPVVDRTVERTHVEVKGLAAGRHLWRVAGIAKDGTQGPFSQPFEVTLRESEGDQSVR